MLKVNNKKTELAYWEVFRDAIDGDVFKIVQSPNPSAIGTHLYMKNHYKGGLAMLAENTTVSPANIVVPSGVITGATFVRVPMHDEIDGLEAMKLISEGTEVLFKESIGYIAVNMFTDFLKMNIVDIDDLLGAKFYVKK